MDKPTFVYTTYIKTTPERLWQALTEPAFTEAYWGIDVRHRLDRRLADDLASARRDDRRRRAGRARVRPLPPAVVHLAHLHARAGRRARLQRRDPRAPRDRAPLEGHLRHRAARRDQVKLTVVHDGLEPGGLTGSLISDGWPRVLANLKTLLETGETLPDRAASARLASLGVTQVVMDHHPRHRNARAVARRPPRAARGREGADPPQRRAGPAPPGAALGPRREGVPLRDGGRPGVARRPVRRALAAARLPLHVRAGLHRPAARRARRSPTASTARSSTSSTTTSRWSPSRGRRSRSCRPTSGGWAGRFPWASSQDSDFNYDFNTSVTEEQQRSGSVDYNYRDGGHDVARRRRSRQHGRPARGDGRHRRRDVHARGAGHERVRARGRRRLPHLLGLRARPRRALGHVPVARPRAEGAQRDRRRGGGGATSTSVALLGAMQGLAPDRVFCRRRVKTRSPSSPDSKIDPSGAGWQSRPSPSAANVQAPEDVGWVLGVCPRETSGPWSRSSSAEPARSASAGGSGRADLHAAPLTSAGALKGFPVPPSTT